jgi:hypothetical protein
VKMMEVRCCCAPKKLLGYLPVPDDTTVGQARTFPFKRPVTIQECAVEKTRVTLLVWWFEDRGDRHLALRGEGLTLEQLRNVVGFEEAWSDHDLAELLMLVRGDGRFQQYGPGLVTYPGADENQDRIHSGCLQLETLRKISRSYEGRRDSRQPYTVWIPR